MSQLTHAIHFPDPVPEDAVVLGDTVLDLETQIEMAEFNLACAQSHLDELRAQKDAEDAEDAHVDAQYQEYLEIEYGKAVMASDAVEKAIAEVL